MFARVLSMIAAALLVSGCENGRDALLADLQSNRPHERAIAVKKLAEQDRAEDLVLFTRAAKDVSGMVREQAVIALSRSQDPRVVDLLGQLLEDTDERVQQQAAKALADVKNEKAKSYLTLQYARRGRSTRIAIVEALKEANVPGAMASVVAAEAKALWASHLRAFTEGSIPERVGAAEQLGESGRAEAVSRLLPVVNDSHVVLASAAVRALGSAGDTRAIPVLTRLLDETYPELREASILALQRLGDPSSLERLRAVALERSSASTFATQAIISFPADPKVNDALCAIALGGSVNDAVEAGRAVRLRGGCPLPPLLDALRSRTPLSALIALRSLGPVAKEAAPRVASLLTSSDPLVRQAALTTLSSLGDLTFAPAVRKLFEEEMAALAEARADWIPGPMPKEFAPGFQPGARLESVDTREVSHAKRERLLAMVDEKREAKVREEGKVPPSRALPELVPDVDPQQLLVTSAALKALGALRVEGALPLLLAHVEERNPTLRNAARVGLASLGTEGIPAAVEGLFEPDRAVQTEIARALAQQGPEGLDALAAALPRIAGSTVGALEALAEVEPPQSLVPLLSRLVTAGGPESVVAAHLLGRMKAKEAVPALVKTLDDPNSSARREVLRALGQIGDPSSASAIARDLCNDLPDIRAAAAEALASVGTPAQIEALDALKGDYYRRVREAAETALHRLGRGAETVKEGPP